MMMSKSDDDDDEERLRYLNLPTLKYRRIIGDMKSIKCFQADMMQP